MYKYLGIEITPHFSLLKIAYSRAGSLKNSLMACSRFLSGKSVPIHVRVRALKAYFLPIATFGGELLGMQQTFANVIQKAFDVGISMAFMGRNPGNCCRSVLYLETGIPTIHAMMSSARIRLACKSSAMRTWISLLQKNPQSLHRGAMKRAWFSTSSFWLKRDGPKGITISGPEAIPDGVKEIRRFLIEKRTDAASEMEKSSRSLYDSRMFALSSTYWGVLTYDHRVIRGVTLLARMRLGIFGTAERMAKARLISELFSQSCPCCEVQTPETIVQILVECKKWRSQRKLMMRALKRGLKEAGWSPAFFNEIYADECATLLLGGAVNGMSLEPLWSKGVEHTSGLTSGNSVIPAAVPEDARRWKQRPLFFYVAAYLDAINVMRRSLVWKDTSKSRGPLVGMAVAMGHVAGASLDS